MPSYGTMSARDAWHFPPPPLETKQGDIMQKVIKEVKKMGSPSEFKGQMYQAVWVTFQDGSSGMANMKAGSNAYGAGDTVNIEVTGRTAKGHDRLKIKKDNGYQQGGGQGGTPQAPQRAYQNPSSGSAALGARVGCSFNAAVALCVAGKIEYSDLELATRHHVDMLAKVEEDAAKGLCSKPNTEPPANSRGAAEFTGGADIDEEDLPF